jgi:hypothetical protein
LCRTSLRNYAAMAKLKRLAYRSAAEKIAERFHLDFH